MKRRLLLITGGLLCLFETPADATRYGAQVYDRWPAAHLAYVSALPLSVVRMDMNVSQIYDSATLTFDWRYMDAAMAALEAEGVRVLLTLFGGNPSRTELPNKNLWARVAQIGLERYQNRHPGMVVALEVGNEPNGTWGYGLRTLQERAVFTAELVENVHRQVAWTRSIKSTPIVCCATIGVFGGNTTTAFWDAALDAGLLQWIDAASVHYYSEDDQLHTGVAGLREAIIARGGAPDFPIHLTEYGAGRPAFAYRVAQVLTMAASADVDIASIFLMRDEPALGVPDHGLVTAAGVPKTPALVLEHWIELFDGQSFTVLNGGAGVMLFQSSNGVRVAWSSVGATLIVQGPHTVEDMLGNPLTPQTSYPLGEAPIYIFRP